MRYIKEMREWRAEDDAGESIIRELLTSCEKACQAGLRK